MPGPVIDWHIVGVDETGDPWNIGNPLPVTGTVSGTVDAEPASKSPTDRSATITLGGTAQQLMAANASRTKWFVGNPLQAETIWISLTGTAAAAAAGSIPVFPGGSIESGPVAETTAISVIAATTGTKVTAWETS